MTQETEEETLIFPFVCVCVLVTQSCPTLCNPTDCSPPGFSVHGILQARILEWIACHLYKKEIQDGKNVGTKGKFSFKYVDDFEVLMRSPSRYFFQKMGNRN